MGVMGAEGMDEVLFCPDAGGAMDAEGIDMGGEPACTDMVGAMDALVPQPDNMYVVFPILSWTVSSTGTGTPGDTQ